MVNNTATIVEPRPDKVLMDFLIANSKTAYSIRQTSDLLNISMGSAKSGMENLSKRHLVISHQRHSGRAYQINPYWKKIMEED